MADIPGVLDKINDLEVAFDASVSEQLLNKIGANINELIDLNTTNIFLTGGTYDIPLNATKLLVVACGGGGGGASGGTNPSSVNDPGPQGGYGALLSMQTIDVTGGETATITIGSGGAGGAATGGGVNGNSGSAGGSTIFSNPSDGARTWFGGPGGLAGITTTATTAEQIISDQRFMRTLAPYHTPGGYNINNTLPSVVSITSGAGLYLGGTNGTNTEPGRIGGGGGGGGSFGVGGNGSNSANPSGPAGSDAAATAYGSGGGASAVGVTMSAKGGDGAQGFFFILRTFS